VFGVKLISLPTVSMTGLDWTDCRFLV